MEYLQKIERYFYYIIFQGYYLPADWASVSNILIENKENRSFKFSLTTLVKIDSVHHDYLGLPDKYSDEDCILNYGHWDR